MVILNQEVFLTFFVFLLRFSVYYEQFFLLFCLFLKILHLHVLCEQVVSVGVLLKDLSVAVLSVLLHFEQVLLLLNRHQILDIP